MGWISKAEALRELRDIGQVWVPSGSMAREVVDAAVRCMRRRPWRVYGGSVGPVAGGVVMVPRKLFGMDGFELVLVPDCDPRGVE